MYFDELMEEVKKMYLSWESDPEINKHFSGDKELIKKEFLTCIQQEIKSNFVILTRKEHENLVDLAWLDSYLYL